MAENERPDGATATGIGWSLIAIGVVAALITSSVETSSGWIIGLALSNLGIGLGVLLLSLGYLVRAIWFLPGRADVPEPDATRSPDSPWTDTKCDWCERVLPAGKTTCTSLSPAQLEKVAGKVKDPTCLQQFEQRGIRSEPLDG